MKKMLFLLMCASFSFYLGAQELEYSDANKTVWYQIQFSTSSLAITQNGAEAPLTLAASNQSDGKQLWKLLQYGDNNEFVKFVNKASESLEIQYLCSDQPDGNGYYGAFIAGSATQDAGFELALKKAGDKYVIYRAVYNKGFALFPVTPDNYIARNVFGNKEYETNEDIRLTFIKHAPDGLSTLVAKKVKISQPNKTTISLELPENSATISILNTVGQTVKAIKSTAKVENIDVSTFAPGVYVVKIEKTSGVETYKVIITK